MAGLKSPSCAIRYTIVPPDPVPSVTSSRSMLSKTSGLPAGFGWVMTLACSSLMVKFSVTAVNE